ncbi:MAG: biopolymer transporter ExbD [Candidatus Krumholzibacteriia bacterium]
MAVMKKKKRLGSMGEVNTSATADISFLLLIFFIVSTIFAEEQGLIMILPGKKREQDDVVRVRESNIATIRVNYDNSLTLDKKPVELNQIKNLVEARILANEKTVVVLETHPDAHYGRMVAVLDELKLANARKLTLKTGKR